VQVLRSAKLIYHWLRNKEFGKGRKPATKHVKKKNRFILGQSMEILMAAIVIQQKTGTEGLFYSRSYIRIADEENGLNLWLRRKFVATTIRHTFPCPRTLNLTETFGTMQLGKKGSPDITYSVLETTWNLLDQRSWTLPTER